MSKNTFLGKFCTFRKSVSLNIKKEAFVLCSFWQCYNKNYNESHSDSQSITFCLLLMINNSSCIAFHIKKDVLLHKIQQCGLLLMEDYVHFWQATTIYFLKGNPILIVFQSDKRAAQWLFLFSLLHVNLILEIKSTATCVLYFIISPQYDCFSICHGLFSIYTHWTPY